MQQLSHVGLGNLRLHPAVGQVREARVADHVARVARDHEAAGVPLVRGQGQLRGEALRLHQRLVVDHDELALVRPAVPLQEDPDSKIAAALLNAVTTAALDDAISSARRTPARWPPCSPRWTDFHWRETPK